MRNDPRLRARRAAATLGLAARGGRRYAASAPALFRSAGRHREQLRLDLALETAEDVTTTLGAMKGVLMKLGQMASYVDDGLAPAVRRTLGGLQDSVPPMHSELAAGVVRKELGAPPERVFARWDPVPIAAASIGQVHRALTHDGQAVAVKVQYPTIASTIAADLDNVSMLRRLMRLVAPSADVEGIVAELRDRLLEEVDYDREAANQRLFAAHFAGHPTITVPDVVPELSTQRVLTTELADGARFPGLAAWSQAERDAAAETIYRFVLRSLYELKAFNGDPHPGNYLFAPGGRVSFVDFGLVRRFTDEELRPLIDMVRSLCVDDDPEGFRRGLEQAGFLRPGAPLSTEQVVDQLAPFYETVRRPGRVTITPDYSARLVRRLFDVRSPIAAYATVPRAYVVLQRINVGLYGVLSELSATADWRAISEEIWPFAAGRASTPIGLAEASWKAHRAAAEAVVAG